jgi:hypothetical protein
MPHDVGVSRYYATAHAEFTGRPALTEHTASPNFRGPDPGLADSPTAFVGLMRQLKEWSGLGFKQLEQRAERAGTPLPHSTLSATLGRSSLPRADLLDAFVRACGCDDDTVAAWLDSRDRLAAGRAPGAAGGRHSSEPTVPPAAAPGSMLSAPQWPTDRGATVYAVVPAHAFVQADGSGAPVPLPASVRRALGRITPAPVRRGGWLVRVCTSALAILTLALFSVTASQSGHNVANNSVAPFAAKPSVEPTEEPDEEEEDPEPVRVAGSAAPRSSAPPSASPAASMGPYQPVNGWYRLRPVHSYSKKMCVGLTESGSRLILTQATCSKSEELHFGMEWAGRSVERVKPRSTRFGKDACMSVVDTGAYNGVHLNRCGDLHSVQQFWTERTRTVGGGAGVVYRLRPTAHPAKCLSVDKKSTAKGALLVEQDCTGGNFQEFALEKA